MSNEDKELGRPPFYITAKERAMQFANNIIRDIPELDGVAVVFSYAVPNPNLDVGYIVGRGGAITNPTEIKHMAEQLLRAAGQALTLLADWVPRIDKLIHDKVAQLNAVPTTAPDRTDSPIT